MKVGPEEEKQESRFPSRGKSLKFPQVISPGTRTHQGMSKVEVYGNPEKATSVVKASRLLSISRSLKPQKHSLDLKAL